eukprot:1850991-Prymnesium_polylepis.1
MSCISRVPRCSRPARRWRRGRHARLAEAAERWAPPGTGFLGATSATGAADKIGVERLGAVGEEVVGGDLPEEQDVHAREDLALLDHVHRAAVERQLDRRPKPNRPGAADDDARGRAGGSLRPQRPLVAQDVHKRAVLVHRTRGSRRSADAVKGVPARGVWRHGILARRAQRMIRRQRGVELVRREEACPRRVYSVGGWHGWMDGCRRWMEAPAWAGLRNTIVNSDDV